jgi:predicted polyphosphate/ATP-dependent NAD kinase
VDALYEITPVIGIPLAVKYAVTLSAVGAIKLAVTEQAVGAFMAGSARVHRPEKNSDVVAERV